MHANHDEIQGAHKNLCFDLEILPLEQKQIKANRNKLCTRAKLHCH